MLVLRAGRPVWAFLAAARPGPEGCGRGGWAGGSGAAGRAELLPLRLCGPCLAGSGLQECRGRGAGGVSRFAPGRSGQRR